MALTLPVENQCLKNIHAAMQDKDVARRQFRLGVTGAFSNYASCQAKVAERFASTCLPAGIEACRQQRLQVVKLIRLEMTAVEHLLRDSPNTYLVYQYRDPRGILASRLENRMLSFKFATEAKLLCEDMLEDIKVLRGISERYNSRIIYIKYEDLAMFPYDVTRDVYAQLGEEVPMQLKYWLSLATKTKQRRERTFGTRRSNSTSVAFKWREKLDSRQIQTATSLCREYLTQMKFDV